VKLAYVGRKDKALAQMKVRYEETKEQRLAYHKEWRAKNPEYNKDKRAKNPDYYKDQRRRCKEKGGEKFFLNNLKKNIQSRIRSALKSGKKSDSTLNILGCSIEKYKIHLESLFVDGMSWSSYGAWHVDHRLPCASFNLANPVHLKACFHYKNCRPLWAKENLSKNDKYDKEEWDLYMKRFVETYIM
jgi:hypothetical protein